MVALLHALLALPLAQVTPEFARSLFATLLKEAFGLAPVLRCADPVSAW